MKGVIIHTPELRTLRQSARDKSLIAALWLVWACLWIPMVNLSAWLGIAAIFYDVAMEAEEDVFSLSFFVGYGFALGGIGVSLAAWTSYNRLRFRRRCRRNRRCRPVGVQELAAFFSVPSKDVLVWRRTRRLSIRTDAGGGIERVESLLAAHSKARSSLR